MVGLDSYCVWFGERWFVECGLGHLWKDGGLKDELLLRG